MRQWMFLIEVAMLLGCGPAPPSGGSVVYYDPDKLIPVVCCGDEYSDNTADCMGCECHSTAKNPQQDNNVCTHDVCKLNDVWIHVPVTQSELDDGDPCTVDTCDPQHGVKHFDTCG